jgi:hypothetical protein
MLRNANGWIILLQQLSSVDKKTQSNELKSMEIIWQPCLLIHLSFCIKKREVIPELNQLCIRPESCVGQSASTDPSFLHICTSWRTAVSFVPQPLYHTGKGTPVLIGQEVGRAPELVCMTWRSENSWPHQDPLVAQPAASRFYRLFYPSPLVLHTLSRVTGCGTDRHPRSRGKSSP